jgi:hypothetical protein
MNAISKVSIPGLVIIFGDVVLTYFRAVADKAPCDPVTRGQVLIQDSKI